MGLIYEYVGFVIFLLISTTSLLPWNLFLNAQQYYYYKLRNASCGWNETRMEDVDDLSSSTELQRSYEAWVSLTSGLSCVLGSVVNFISTERLGNSFRMRLGHLMVLLALIPTVLLTYIDTDSNQTIFFWLSMFLASFASFGSIGLIGSGLLGLAAKFPPVQVQAVMIGQSVAGILSTLLSILCQWSTTDAVLNGRFFFLIACVWTGFSVILHEYLSKSLGIHALIERGMPDDQSSSQRLLEAEYGSQQSLQLRVNESCLLKEDAAIIWSKTKSDWFSGFLVLVGTLAAFPALASLVVTSTNNTVWKYYFTSVACFLVFNCGDMVGRLLVKLITLSDAKLMIFSIARLLFIPLFFFCNIITRYHSITIFYNDNVYIGAMIAFSISNGFCFSLANISATRKVDTNLRELTGSLFGLMGVLSTFIGSLIGLLLVKFV